MKWSHASSSHGLIDDDSEEEELWLGLSRHQQVGGESPPLLDPHHHMKPLTANPTRSSSNSIHNYGFSEESEDDGDSLDEDARMALLLQQNDSTMGLRDDSHNSSSSATGKNQSLNTSLQRRSYSSLSSSNQAAESPLQSSPAAQSATPPQNDHLFIKLNQFLESSDEEELSYAPSDTNRKNSRTSTGKNRNGSRSKKQQRNSTKKTHHQERINKLAERFRIEEILGTSPAASKNIRKHNLLSKYSSLRDEEDVQLDHSFNQLKKLLSNTDAAEPPSRYSSPRQRTHDTHKARNSPRSRKPGLNSSLGKRRNATPTESRLSAKGRVHSNGTSRHSTVSNRPRTNSLRSIYKSLLKETPKHSSILYGNYLNAAVKDAQRMRGDMNSNPSTKQQNSTESPTPRLMSETQNSIVNFKRVSSDQDEDDVSLEEEDSVRQQLSRMRSQRVTDIVDPWNHDNGATSSGQFVEENEEVSGSIDEALTQDEIDWEIKQNSKKSKQLKKEKKSRKRRNRAYQNSEKSKQSTFNRLYATSKSTRAKLELMRKKKEEEEMKACSFSPRLSTGSRMLHTGNSHEDFLRRQQEAIERKKALVQERKKQIEKSEKSLSFSPNINASSKNLDRSLEHIISWGEERNSRRNQQQSDLEKLSYSFRPYVSDRSKKLVAKYKKRKKKEENSKKEAREDPNSGGGASSNDKHEKKDQETNTATQEESKDTAMADSSKASKFISPPPAQHTPPAATKNTPSRYSMDEVHSAISLDLSSERDEWMESRRNSLATCEEERLSITSTPRRTEQPPLKKVSPAVSGIEELSVPQMV